eukprot:14481569-Alexandrium_andersonii.AAC.1
MRYNGGDQLEEWYHDDAVDDDGHRDLKAGAYADAGGDAAGDDEYLGGDGQAGGDGCGGGGDEANE